MPTPKFFVRQYQDKSGRTYMVHRYWDNHLNNYEYQVYELKMAKPIARLLGSPELSNTRQMCDWVWKNVESIDGDYIEGKD
ncbi:hypothetical protein EWU23_12000 [Cytophagaceae bacterium 50C-KIRBA]|uniref:Uncharacterized protein n=1 Tax=Aquirufa beregesia TaxID=2516556 RepID=A0ABX0F0H6_9BACT|nr:hypothetical protein [Aquirufa beregesia]NGZ45198.1 hypothetical protein [Aquirufa beregesia]